jgi:hypothetical protein
MSDNPITAIRCSKSKSGKYTVRVVPEFRSGVNVEFKEKLIDNFLEKPSDHLILKLDRFVQYLYWNKSGLGNIRMIKNKNEKEVESNGWKYIIYFKYDGVLHKEKTCLYNLSHHLNGWWEDLAYNEIADWSDGDDYDY